MTASSPPPAAPAAPDWLARFRAQGHFLHRAVFSEDECLEIIAAQEQLRFGLDVGPRDEGALKYRPMPHLVSPTLQAFACDRRWRDLVLPALEADARLFWEQGVARPPGAGAVLPWHQDSGYTPTRPEFYLTCWLALDDADAQNGCLWCIPDSHLDGVRPHRNDPRFVGFRVGYEGDEPGIALPAKRGDVRMMSSLLMHRSTGNLSQRQRRAWILQYCAAGAVSGLSGRPLDDRLRLSRDGHWLDTPLRERPFDLARSLVRYDHRS